MKNRKYKIGVVYFDDIHIVPHFIGPVKAFFNDPDFDVNILTHQGENGFLFESLERHHLPAGLVKQLPTYGYRQFIEKIKKRKKPSPYYLFKKHKKKLLNEYDVLIFNDINHEYLYRNRKGKHPRFVLLMHGAGDGEYLIGSRYRDAVSKFDLITTSGPKITGYFRKMNLPETQIVPCGYQKFDIIDDTVKHRFFDNDNPVILYNPHFKRNLSSWYQFGPQILEFFFRNRNYNLIFAPHINLFNKRGFLKPEIIPKKYFEADNIRIDLGSKHSVNMDYTLAADIYLGDVSSQIYEFLYRLRPAVFINTHRRDWQNDPHYLHWHAGEVIRNLHDLASLLNTASRWHKKYIDKQKELMDYTFKSVKKGEASENIKRAVKALLKNDGQG